MDLPPLPPLPLSPGPMVGREQEVAAATAQLRRGVRLLTFVGPGGIGKTRLAIEVVGRVSGGPGREAGSGFVDLADVREASQVAPVLARALGVRDAPGDRAGADPALHLAAALEHRSLTLLLDNFEQVVDAAPLLAALLERCAGLRLVITSRVPLHLRWEYEFPVPPLALPQPAAWAPAAVALESPAVQLFVARAQAVRPQFQLTDDNTATVVAICRRLDGLPLALELAAGSLRVLSPEALNARLEQHRLDVLHGGPRDAHARQRTLRSTIEWSDALLPPDERALLRQLGVFAGGADLSAVAAICPAAGVIPAPQTNGPALRTSGRAGTLAGNPGQGQAGGEQAQALERIAHLVEHSLVRAAEGRGTEPRFDQLETIREFARESLARSGEEESLRERHAAYYAALVERIGSLLWGAEQITWLERLEADWENLRAALAWWHAHAGSEAAAVRGLRLAAGLQRYWTQRGRHIEGREWLGRLLAAAPSWPAGDVPAAAAAARGQALVAAAVLALVQRDHVATRRLLEEADRLGDPLGDGDLPARVSLWLATLEVNEERPADALARLQGLTPPAGEGARHWGWELAFAQLQVGRAALALGAMADAEAAFQDSLHRFRSLGDTWTTCLPLVQLGLIAVRQGDLSLAWERLQEAVTLARRGGDPWATAVTLQQLGVVAQARQDTGAARRLLQESATLFEAMGNLDSRDDSLRALAAPAAAPARPAAAEASQGPSRAATAGVQMALSAREQEVLRLVAQGLTNVQVAEQLVISPVTVSAHLRVIFSKLGVSSRTAAARAALDQGLV